MTSAWHDANPYQPSGDVRGVGLSPELNSLDSHLRSEEQRLQAVEHKSRSRDRREKKEGFLQKPYHLEE